MPVEKVGSYTKLNALIWDRKNNYPESGVDWSIGALKMVFLERFQTGNKDPKQRMREWMRTKSGYRVLWVFTVIFPENYA